MGGGPIVSMVKITVTNDKRVSKVCTGRIIISAC